MVVRDAGPLPGSDRSDGRAARRCWSGSAAIRDLDQGVGRLPFDSPIGAGRGPSPRGRRGEEVCVLGTPSDNPTRPRLASAGKFVWEPATIRARREHPPASPGFLLDIHTRQGGLNPLRAATVPPPRTTPARRSSRQVRETTATPCHPVSRETPSRQSGAILVRPLRGSGHHCGRLGVRRIRPTSRCGQPAGEGSIRPDPAFQIARRRPEEDGPTR